jgi:hypothetical protein
VELVHEKGEVGEKGETGELVPQPPSSTDSLVGSQECAVDMSLPVACTVLDTKRPQRYSHRQKRQRDFCGH